MANPYAALLAPGRIGKLELRNRIVMAPMGSSFGGHDGKVTERLLAYYEARAKGGAGLLTTGVCAIAFPAGTSEPHQLGISGDEFIPGLAQLVERAHRHGAKMAIQLVHHGKVAARDIAEGRELWVPSVPPPGKAGFVATLSHEEMATFVSNLGSTPPRYRVMDAADIAQMTAWFVAAAARAKRAGFDGIELHAAHNYIFAGFLSPHYNQRTDAWGGPLENRARLLLDTIRAVKAEVGTDFPVWLRLDGRELHTEHGITLEDAVATARLAEQAGVDAVHVSAYASIDTGGEFSDAPLPQQPGAYIPFAAAVRKAINVPVIVAGRVEPEAGAQGIAAGDFDFVAMARKLLADPDLPNKLAAGRPQDVRPCVYCYVCVSQIFLNESVKCAVNALTGHEHDTRIEPAATPRRILVIGGGPAGMEAARVAAERGHQVTLVERSNRLGGTLFFAGLAYPENGRLLDYLVAQMQHPNIEVKLDTTATREWVTALAPDRIIVATGARRAAPAIPGADQRHVWSGDELRRLLTGDRADEIAHAKLSLAERALFKAGGMLGVVDSRQALQRMSKLWMPLGKRVVIIGGGLVGLELAEFLLAREREVTVLEASDRAGRELSVVRRWRVLDAVREHGKLELQATVDAIGKQAVDWHDAKGVAHATPADSVVLAVGAEPDNRLAQSLADLGIPLDEIGDGASLGYIEGAMHRGNRAGRMA